MRTSSAAAAAAAAVTSGVARTLSAPSPHDSHAAGRGSARPDPKPSKSAAATAAAVKSGHRATFYAVSGDTYLGSWENDRFHGQGIHRSPRRQEIYEGHFEAGERGGFGTLWQGPFEHNHKVYAGQWRHGKRHGQGTAYYHAPHPEAGGTYTGMWSDGMRTGWGRMTYADGGLYEGEWWQDQRHGDGVHVLPNGNRYDGTWFNDLKEGPGKFYYRDTRRCCEGEWVRDTMTCGVMTDLPPLAGRAPNPHPIPAIGLAHADDVVATEKAAIRERRAEALFQATW